MSMVMDFEEIRKDDVMVAGGKGANLGEMSAAGIAVPDGFVITADAYRAFLKENGLEETFENELKKAGKDEAGLLEAARKFRELIGYKIGSKKTQIIYADKDTKEVPVSAKLQSERCLNDQEIAALCAEAVKVEKHYGSQYPALEKKIKHFRYFHVVREESQYLWETLFYYVRQCHVTKNRRTGRCRSGSYIFFGYSHGIRNRCSPYDDVDRMGQTFGWFHRRKCFPTVSGLYNGVSEDYSVQCSF